jgi:hypothetical protein
MRRWIAKYRFRRARREILPSVHFLSFDSIGRIHGLIELATVQDDKPTATGIPDGMRNATSRLQPMGQMMDTSGDGVPHRGPV